MRGPTKPCVSRSSARLGPQNHPFSGSCLRPCPVKPMCDMCVHVPAYVRAHPRARPFSNTPPVTLLAPRSQSVTCGGLGHVQTHILPGPRSVRSGDGNCDSSGDSSMLTMSTLLPALRSSNPLESVHVNMHKHTLVYKYLYVKAHSHCTLRPCSSHTYLYKSSNVGQLK